MIGEYLKVKENSRAGRNRKASAKRGEHLELYCPNPAEMRRAARVRNSSTIFGTSLSPLTQVLTLFSTLRHGKGGREAAIECARGSHVAVEDIAGCCVCSNGGFHGGRGRRRGAHVAAGKAG